MTSGFTAARASASLTTPENSRSTMTTLLSAWSSWKAITAASRRVFSECSTALTIGTPKWASSMGGVLDSITVTVSPLPMPRRASAEASRSDLCQNVAVVDVLPAMHDRQMVRIGLRRAFEQGDRRERLMIGDGLLETAVIDARQGLLPFDWRGGY